jgi:hypothetical protein
MDVPPRGFYLGRKTEVGFAAHRAQRTQSSEFCQRPFEETDISEELSARRTNDLIGNFAICIGIMQALNEQSSVVDPTTIDH